MSKHTPLMRAGSSLISDTFRLTRRSFWQVSETLPIMIGGLVPMSQAIRPMGVKLSLMSGTFRQVS